MKQSHFLPFVLVALFMSSCTTYQFTARQTDVRQRQIDQKDQMVSIVVDYNRQVTATSDYQMSRKDAIAEAEYRCIQEAKIDVVVDPIYKVEYNPFKMKMRYKATIIGYAGKYKEELNRLDDSKKYTLEEIEKYKLLYDPAFPQNYYRKSSEGDNYFFKSGALSSKSSSEAPAFGWFNKKKGEESNLSSLMFKNNQKAPRANSNELKPVDINEALRLRNTGIGLMAGGAAAALIVGLPLMLASNSDAGEISGIVVTGLGAAICIYAGIPTLCVGQVRYDRAKKERSMDITLNTGSNGIGLGLTF